MIVARAAMSAMALMLLIPAVANAQAPRNPFSDLFGRPPDRTGKEFTAIQFGSEVGAQWGQVLKQEFTPPDAVVPEGLSAGADAVLTADYVRDRAQVVAQGRYSYQEYRQEPAFGAPGFDAGVRANLQPTTRLALHGGGHYARAPFYQLIWLAPDPATVVPIDRSAILLMRSDSIDGSAGVTSNFTRRSSIDLTGEVRQTRFAFLPDNDFSSIGARARWKRQMSRDLGVHAGYGREQMRQNFADGPREYINELLDIGVDYARATSLARRTSLSFATETSMLRENGGERHFRINGSVLLERRFLRTWVVQGGARRATEFLPGFRAPVFTESAQAVLAGYLSKRMLLSLAADGGQGEAGFNDPRKYISYTGSAKLTFAVTRHLGVFTQYVYYHYQTPPDPLTLFLLPQGARQAFSVGVRTWIPLLEKERVPRDPR